MKSKENLIHIVNNHFYSPFNELLVEEIQESIRLKTIPNKTVQLGDTKMGGIPHLPKGITWPKDEKTGTYHTFVAQINLQQIASYDNENKLPQQGILYFFIYDWYGGTVLYEPNIANIYLPSPPVEVTIEHKSFFQKLFGWKGYKILLEECGVEIFKEYHLPQEESLEFDKFCLNNQIKNIRRVTKEEVYEDEMLYDADDNEMTPNHHLFGYYNHIQFGYYQLDCTSIKKKSSRLNLDEINQALEWKLLLQVSFDDKLNLHIGDAGQMYFFIHEDDLVNQRFDKVKIIGECY